MKIIKKMILDINKDIDECMKSLIYNVEQKSKLKRFKKDNTILKQPNEYKNYAEYLMERIEKEGELE